MAKLRMKADKALEALLPHEPIGDVAIHRAWMDGDDLVLDLRGSGVPDCEEIVKEIVTVQEERTTIWTIWKTRFRQR